MTDKKKWTIAFIVIAIIVLWLLWRNRSKVAPTLFNDPPPNYLDVNYPAFNLSNPGIPSANSSASCGCNPNASQFLSGANDSFNKAQDEIDKALKNYTDQMNQYFQTNTKQ